MEHMVIYLLCAPFLFIMDENTLKFKYGTTDYDANQIAEYLHDNAQGWLQSQGLTGKKGEAALASINDLIGRIQSGDIDNVQFDGVVNSKSGTFNDNSKDKKFLGIKVGHDVGSNNIAAEFLNQGLAQLKGSNLSSTSESTKEKFGDKDRIHQAWVNKYFGGKDPGDDLEQVWSSRDVVNEEGVRSRTNRLNEFAGVLDSLYNDSSLNDLDYNGSAFTNADAYREALKSASNAARSGNYDEFLRAYAAAGGDTKAANIMFSDKIVRKNVDNDKQSALLEQGYSEEDANKILQSEANREKRLRDYRLLKATENDDYNKIANSYIWSGQDTGIKSYDFINSVAGETGGWDGKYNKQRARDVLNEFLNTGNIDYKTRDEFGLTNAAYIYKLLDQDKKDGRFDDPLEYTKTQSGKYIINGSIKDDGTAWAWDPINYKLVKIYARHNTPTLQKLLRERWSKNRYSAYEDLNTEQVQSNKKGGVLKALSGASLNSWDAAQNNYTKAKNEKKAAELKLLKQKQEERKNKAEKAGKTVEQYDKSQRELRDGLKIQDYARLTSLLLDAASIGSSKAYGWGTIGSAATGLLSTAINAGADYADGTLSAGNVGLSLAADAAALSGVGDSVKFAKMVKTVRPLAKSLKYTLMASGAFTAGSEIFQTLDKLTDPNAHFGAEDASNLTNAIKILLGFRRGQLASKRVKEMKAKATNSKGLQTVKATNGEGKTRDVIVNDNDVKNIKKGKLTERKGYTFDVDTRSKINPLRYIKSKNKVDVTVHPDTYDWSQLGDEYTKGKYFSDAYLFTGWKPSKRKGGELKKLRQGDSIQKFLPEGNMYSSDFKIPTMDDNNSWYWNRWAQHELGGRNANATVGNSTPLAGADHNKDFTLGMAYAKNDAYTGQSNLVRNDLQNYIDEGGDDYSDLASLVNGYNKHIGTLNNFWQNKGYTANVASDATAAHNDLFRRLYASRSDNSANNNAQIGWQEDGVAGKRYMGTSTWMRRADQYADKFADLKNDNDIRNRLHQVTLKNGTKGYVYKEADGTIGIADNALLQRLGLGTSNNPQTPQNPDQNPQVQQNPNAAHRVDLNQAQSVLKNLKLGTLVKDLPWNKITNYIDTNQVNKEMLDLANKETTALQRHTPITDNVRNGFSQEQFANRMADNIKQAGATAARNTTDAATAMSILMEANAKADETRQQGKVASDQITEQSKQNVTKYRDNNIAQADADFNENNAKLAALHNSILTNKAGKLVQDHANKVQFRNDIKAWMDTKEQNQRQFKAKALQQQMELSQKILADPYLEKLRTLDQNSSEYKDVLAKYQKSMQDFQEKNMANYYNQLAQINGIDFNFKDNPFNESQYIFKKEGGKLEQLVSLKKGGSTHRTSDDGPRRTRAKDLDRHEKNRKNYADQVEKKKERLARLKGKYVDRYLK